MQASVTDAFTQLVEGIQAGIDWDLVGQADGVRALLDGVFKERIHLGDRARYQIRVNLQKKSDVASYAGFIVEEGNPTSRSLSSPVRRFAFEFSEWRRPPSAC